jgi:hypothetical protein
MFKMKKVELSEKLTVEGSNVSSLKEDQQNHCLVCNPKGLKIQLYETKVVVEGSRRISMSEEVIWRGTYDPNKPEYMNFKATLWHHKIVKGRYPRLSSGEHEIKVSEGNTNKELMKDFGEDVERAVRIANEVIALRTDPKVQVHFDKKRIRSSRLE